MRLSTFLLTGDLYDYYYDYEIAYILPIQPVQKAHRAGNALRAWGAHTQAGCWKQSYSFSSKY